MKASQLKTTLKWAFKNQHSILIKGMPGVGKTDITKWSAKKAKQDILILHPVVDDPTDYKGLGFVIDGKAEFIPYGNLRKVMNAKKPLVVFFDDLGQASDAVQKAVMQLLLAREINGKKISKHVTFVAATNRKEDRAGVSGLLEPVKSRFMTIVELEHDVDEWCEWAHKKKMPSELISYAQFRRRGLFEFKPTRDLTNSCIGRTLANVGKAIKTKVPESVRFDVFAGAIGRKKALDFTAYLKVYANLPTIDEIKKNPLSAKIPPEASGKYAVMGLIVDAMNSKYMGAFIKYLDRLGTEITTAAMKVTSIKKPEECKNTDYVMWVTKHGANLN